jgi:hypothetical protein
LLLRDAVSSARPMQVQLRNQLVAFRLRKQTLTLRFEQY